jgi:hypothetical protein
MDDILAPAPAPAAAAAPAPEPEPESEFESEREPAKPQRVGIIDIRFVDVW